MRLYVSGGSHINWDSDEDLEKFTQVLDGRPEVIFTETRSEPDDNKEQWLNRLTAPLVLISIVVYSIILAILRVPFNSDKELVDTLTSTLDVDNISVDRPLRPLISEGRWAWAIANWISIIITIFLYWAAGLAVALLYLLIFISVIFFSFIAGTASPRNYAIAMNTMKAAKQNGYERGVLKVGSEHEEEVKQHIREASDLIEIVEFE